MVVLIKIGALGMQEDLVRPFVVKVREVARDHPVVLFPGGGVFADMVRREDQEHYLGAEVAHWRAIHAMDQMGLYLANTCPGLHLCIQPGDVLQFLAGIPRMAKDGLPEVPLWLPEAWLRQIDPTPHSWDVTSDSLAVIAGASVGVEWVGLAKITDHLTKDLPFSASPRLRAKDLRKWMDASKTPNMREEWAVDLYLPRAIKATKISCKVFDGRDLANLPSLMRGDGNPKYAEIYP